MASSVTRDEVEIREIIARQFGAMSWKEGEGPDFDKFRSDFHPEARLFASARPLSPQSVTDFEKRMSGIAGTSLRSFDETVLGCEITVFGNDNYHIW